MKILDTDNKEEVLQYLNNLTSYTIKLEHRINKAILILNKRKEDVEDFAWVEMRRNSYYEECDEVIKILKGDSND